MPEGICLLPSVSIIVLQLLPREEANMCVPCLHAVFCPLMPCTLVPFHALWACLPCRPTMNHSVAISFIVDHVPHSTYGGGRRGNVLPCSLLFLPPSILCMLLYKPSHPHIFPLSMATMPTMYLCACDATMWSGGGNSVPSPSTSSLCLIMYILCPACLSPGFSSHAYVWGRCYLTPLFCWGRRGTYSIVPVLPALLH